MRKTSISAVAAKEISIQILKKGNLVLEEITLTLCTELFTRHFLIEETLCNNIFIFKHRDHVTKCWIPHSFLTVKGG